MIYYSCCCCCSCNTGRVYSDSAPGSVRCTECTKYFYRATLCYVGLCHGGPLSVRLFVTSRSRAHNSRLQSRAHICAHYRWHCLNVLPCALQKWLNRSTAKASNRLRYTLSVGIFVAQKWVDSVVIVERHTERVLVLKMVLGDCLLNVFTVYAPHSGKLDEEKEFLERSISFGKLYTPK